MAVLWTGVRFSPPPPEELLVTGRLKSEETNESFSDGGDRFRHGMQSMKDNPLGGVTAR